MKLINERKKSKEKRVKKKEIYMRTFEAKNRGEWRNWLENNKSSEEEIWLVYYKKHIGKPSISYLESVEEAICFGWIDGLKRRLDDERYAHRFTRRRKDSKWSTANIDIAKRMIKSGLMTSEGQTSFQHRKEYDKEFLKSRSGISIEVPSDLEKILRENGNAWDNFSKLAQSHRKQYILWVNSAKKDETRQRRLMESLKLLKQNEKLGMK
jgi:uncharacterized protein YdeI (YjbR/CyaY-like superfamily)